MRPRRGNHWQGTDLPGLCNAKNNMMVSRLLLLMGFALIRLSEKFRMWKQHQASWRATYWKRGRRLAAGVISSNSQTEPPSDTATTQGDNSRDRYTGVQNHRPDVGQSSARERTATRSDFVRTTMSPALLSLGPSPSLADPPSRRSIMRPFEQNVSTSSGSAESPLNQALVAPEAAVRGEATLPLIYRPDSLSLGLQNNVRAIDDTTTPHSQYHVSGQPLVLEPPSQSHYLYPPQGDDPQGLQNRSSGVEPFLSRQPSLCSTIDRPAQNAVTGEPQIVDTSHCVHHMLPGRHIDVEPQSIDTSLRPSYMLHPLNQFGPS